MKKTTILTSLFALAASTIMISCCGSGSCDKTASCDKAATCDSACQTTCNKMKTPYQKKYTNADFYKDGVFQQDAAKAAFLDMFAHYDIPMTPLMEKDIWFVDFGLGDFENCGMGGIFWVNDSVNSYFAHEIYLLPGQMIPEHKHVKTKFPAKFESWMVQKGNCYNFSEVGEATPNAPTIPASQAATTISKNFVLQNPGEIVHLKEVGTFHFLMAGPEGAVVSEYANYHDGSGLRFTNTKAVM